MPEVKRNTEQQNTYRGAANVTPHDTNELPTWSRKLYVGGTGNITLVTAEGQTVLYSALPVGAQIEVSAKIIKSTGTTATLIVAMW